VTGTGSEPPQSLAEVHRQTQVLRIEQLRAVAKLVCGIYRAIGLLSKGQLVEVDRSELVAGDQYGEEAIDTLVKEMEDRRDELLRAAPRGEGFGNGNREVVR
jgi:hypothetical protein